MEKEKPKFNKTKYNNEFIAKNYDQVRFVVPKGKKEKIKAAADLAGVSVNGYIAQAIEEKMKRDGFQYGEDTEE